jgi:hypothetical protein
MATLAEGKLTDEAISTVKEVAKELVASFKE